MSQNVEATAFLARIAQLPPGPGASLDAVLQPSLEDEATLRKLFAQDKTNPRLKDLHVGLVDLFEAPADIRVTRARVVQDEHDLSAKYIMPLSREKRRKDGTPCMVSDFEEFRKNWAIFTEGSLSQLIDWNNVVAAGGAVQACLSPVPDNYKVSKRALRKHFHSHAYPTSDIDLFLYGLTPEQAEIKINEIYEAVRDCIPWDVTCIRTKHTVSIHSQYPYRAIQIILRLYQSPAEIIAGFDVDSPCCAYDGNNVWASPRAVVAMMRQCNTADITRRSPSYEIRLSKYTSRGFEVYVPQLNRDDIDPTIFERSIVRIQGLARLLVLERLATAISRDQYLLNRRVLRGRPNRPYEWRRRAKKYKGDLKQDADAGLELSDYDVVGLHIPYGPGWDARRIEKLVYQIDLSMNSPYNPKNEDRTLHRHAAFFGTMTECLEDCCECCVEPKDDEERALQETEDKSYVRGRITFIEEDPGRQCISGSFNPTDEGEWAEQAYMGATEKFFTAIAAHDRVAVKRMIAEGADVDRRDHVGRTPLQVAILSKAEEIACDLVDADARMTLRLEDGRTALHLAAHLGMSVAVRKLLERSALNDQAVKEAERQKESQLTEESDDTETDNDHSTSCDSDSEMRDSSDDDWDSDNGKSRKQKASDDNKTTSEGENIPEDEEDVPDVFNVNVRDWDYGLTALDYAVIGGSIPVVELLTSAGADPKSSNDINHTQSLTLTAATEDVDVACKIIEKLLAAGAVSSEANASLFSVFHRMIYSAQPKLVFTLLRADPNAKAALDVPFIDSSYLAIFPIVSAIISGSYSILALLLAYGVKLVLSEDNFQRARDMKLQNDGRAPYNFFYSGVTPIEMALSRQDDIVHLLVALGAEINSITRGSSLQAVDQGRMSLLDFTRTIAVKVAGAITPPKPQIDTNSSASLSASAVGLLTLPTLGLNPTPHSLGLLGIGSRHESIAAWKIELQKVVSKCNAIESHHHNVEQDESYIEIKAYFDEVEPLLVSYGAKTAAELSSVDVPEAVRNSQLEAQIYGPYVRQPNGAAIASCFFWRFGRYHDCLDENTTVATLYYELFAACWDGDNAKIQRLCLPQSNHKKPDLPIQVAVRWGDRYERGHTPLHIACFRRHWDTARLIIAIATSQHSPEESNAQAFTPINLSLDDDSDTDNDSDEDEEMEDELEEQGINFVDIAKRPTTIHTKARASDMLNLTVFYLSKDESGYSQHTLAVQLIAEDDFEAFIQILDLYRYVEEIDTPGLDYSGAILAALLKYDRPAMLDEYIRRTGLGVYLKADAQDVDVANTALQGPKAYLGLNVHGKKRKDLARKAGPNAPQQVTMGEGIPILWQAAQAGSLGVIKYLASDQPLAAYKFYASSHSDERAKLLKQISDLTAVLPAKLGWTTNVLNESVLTAAIISNQKEVIETLSSLRPTEIDSFARLSHKTLEFNSLLAAARWGCDPWVFDFLLGKKVPPMEVDHSGFNIYHLLCAYEGENWMKLFKHALHQLPDGVTEFLLRQQTKERHNTPLHIAVKTNRLDYVRLLVGTGVAQYLQRDANGCTPLHVAIKFGHPEITRLIAAAGPVEALTLEDAVGNTPLETITRDAFKYKINAASLPGTYVSGLQPQFNWNRKVFNVPQQETELARLKETIQGLLDEGRLINGTKLAKELLACADRLETKIAKVKAAEEDEKEHKEKVGWTREQDMKYAPAVLRVLLEALAARPGPRHLVHLSDVHESVKTSLITTLDAVRAPAQYTMPVRDDGFGAQEQKPLPNSLLTNCYFARDQRRMNSGDIWHKL